MGDAATLMGSVIRGLRERRQLSQENLASLAGLSRPFIGEIERGESNFSFITFLALAQGLGISPSELMRSFERECANE